MKRPGKQALRMDDQEHGRAPYEPPAIRSYTEEDLLEIVGPAQAYSSPLPGTSGGGSL